MTKEFNFKEFLTHKDFYELKNMMDTIQQEICFREKENYENLVKGVLTAIQDLIDNGFGNEIATPNCNTWKELFTQIEECYY